LGAQNEETALTLSVVRLTAKAWSTAATKKVTASLGKKETPSFPRGSTRNGKKTGNHRKQITQAH